MIETPRLRLRPWRDEDAEPFAALNADPEVTRYLGGPKTREDSDAALDRMRTHLRQHGFTFWAVERLDEPGLLGFTGLVRPKFDAHFTPAVEVGWRFRRSAWGHGYATEAARAALRFGFETLGLEEIVSLTVPDNVRSRAVMERLGMTRRPEDDFEHPLLPAGHPLRLHVLYRLSRGAWRVDAPAHTGP